MSAQSRFGGPNPPLDGLTPVFEELGADPRVVPGADRPPASVAKIGTLYLSKCGSAATDWRTLPCEIVAQGGVGTGGNTAGQTGLVDGSLVLAGIGNVTLSQLTDSLGGTISIIVNDAYGISTQGNTQGLTGLTHGSLVLVGGANITLSQSLNSQGATVSILGNTSSATAAALALRAGTQLATSGTVVFSDSNGITFGMSGSTQVTASISREPSLAAGSQTASSGTVVFANSNGITFGMSGSSQVTASYSQSTAPAALAAGTQTASSGTVVFSNSNGITFGLSGSQLTASYSQSTAPAALAAGSQTASSGTVVFSNSNGITFGLSGSQLTASYSQSTAPAALAAGSQTASSGTAVFANSNGLTFGMSGSSQVTMSFDGIRRIAGNTGEVTPNAIGRVLFDRSNGITFDGTGSVMTASYDGVRSQIVLDSNGAASQTAIAQALLQFSNANGVSWGFSTSAVTNRIITASVAAQSTAPAALAAGTQTASSGTLVFSNSNGITFGMSGSTQVTASYSQSTAARSYMVNNGNDRGVFIGDISQATIHIAPFEAWAPIKATRADQINNVSNSGNAAATVTMRLGLYTMSGSTASRVSSTSRVWSYASNLASSSYTQVSGTRYRSMALGTWDITAGPYLMAVQSSIATGGGTSGTHQPHGGRDLSLVANEYPLGLGTSPAYFNGGFFSVTSGALPASFHLTDIISTGANDVIFVPFVTFAGTF